MRDRKKNEPLWDIRTTAHRAGLLLLLILYLALMAVLIYGNSAGRECRRRELPWSSIH